MDVVGSKTLEIMSAAPWYHEWTVGKMKKYLKGDILEVGAGVGNITKLLTQHGEVTAIDFDRRYLSRLKKRKFNAGFGDIEKGQYFFKNCKFDTVISTNVLEHIKDDMRALRNMYKLLKKDGHLILFVPAHQWAYGKIDKELGHFRRYSKKVLAKMFADLGLEVVVARYLNWFSLPGWVLNGKVLKRGLIPLRQLKLFDIVARPFLLIENFVKLPFGQSVLIIGRKK
ncbi:class I SAM-dependent methyltransferase [Candidatus Daviesbacteria bacterium]|nr:class I SAM-dependent methyltransferase [Candidatus Daviesbacteria bacterium]